VVTYRCILIVGCRWIVSAAWSSVNGKKPARHHQYPSRVTCSVHVTFNEQYDKSEKEKEVDRVKIPHFEWYEVI
jgi:hypothetical protein